MSAQETEEEDDEGFFPVLNRETPILDRLRKRRRQLQSNGTENDLAQQIATAALTDQPIDEEFLSQLRQDIANELDIPEENISGMFITELRNVLSPSIDDLVVEQTEEVEESEETESEESEEEEDTDVAFGSDDEEEEESEADEML